MKCHCMINELILFTEMVVALPVLMKLTQNIYRKNAKLTRLEMFYEGKYDQFTNQPSIVIGFVLFQKFGNVNFYGF